MQKRDGFTLIELLVVIAIIAILAAILFPVFAQAREKARQTDCLSNQKQIALAFLQYVQDYDERFPGSTDAYSIIDPAQQFTAASDGINDWSWEMYDTGPGGEARMTWDVLIQPYMKSIGCFTCPDDPQRGTTVISYGGARVERSYSVANGIIDYKHTGHGTILAQVPAPSSTVLTDERSWCPLGGQSDAANDNDWWWASCQDTETPDELGYTGTAGNGKWPHNDYIAMFAYADGHVHPVVWQGAGHPGAVIGSNLFPGYPLTNNSTTTGSVPDFNDVNQPFPLN